jgi:hypothetical protein
MRWNWRRRRRRLTGTLAAGLVLAQIAGCSSCVDDAKKEERPAVSGPQLSPKAKITDKRPARVLPALEDAGADATP